MLLLNCRLIGFQIILLLLPNVINGLPVNEKNVKTSLSDASSNCILNCADFNRLNPDESCASSPSECGACIKGFKHEEDYSCVKSKIVTTSPDLFQDPPTFIYLHLNQSYTFTCLLKSDADCVWLRDGHQVLISDRYKYISYKKGVKSKDCSMTISPLHRIDLTRWRCGSMAESDGEGVLSTEVHLQEMHYITYHPKNISVHQGDNITMHCKLNAEVDCFWMRQSYHVEVRDRYQYTDGKNGRNSSDCSLTITDIQQMDLTYWQCGGMATYVDPGTLSQKVWIKINDSRAQSDSPSVKVGENVILKCIVNEEINCQWSRNGYLMKIESRYTYVSSIGGLNTADCSIQIQNVQKTDDGLWECGQVSSQNLTGSIFASARLKVLSNALKEDILNDKPILTEIELRPSNKDQPTGHLSLSNGSTKVKSRSSMSTSIHPKMVKYPVSMIAMSGSNITLPCIFDTKVKCIWLKDGSTAQIGDRYKYLRDGDSENVEDCSIQVSSLAPEDGGHWRCGCVADETTAGILSDGALLNVVIVIHQKEAALNARTEWILIIVTLVLLSTAVIVALVLFYGPNSNRNCTEHRHGSKDEYTNLNKSEEGTPENVS